MKAFLMATKPSEYHLLVSNMVAVFIDTPSTSVLTESVRAVTQLDHSNSGSPKRRASLSKPQITEMAGRAVVLTLVLSACSLAASRDILSDFGDDNLCALFGLNCPNSDSNYGPACGPYAAPEPAPAVASPQIWTHLKVSLPFPPPP